MKILKKSLKVIALVLAVIIAILLLFYSQHTVNKDPGWGLNFSITQAEYLGFDWREVYYPMLDELKPERLRLTAYWELIEPKQGQFNFSDLDEMLSEAQERDIAVILVIGR